jgi:hypothetical protein
MEISLDSVPLWMTHFRGNVVDLKLVDTWFMTERSTGICTRVVTENGQINFDSNLYERTIVRHYEEPGRALEAFVHATVPVDRFDDDWFDQLAHGYDNYDSSFRVPVSVWWNHNSTILSPIVTKENVRMYLLDYILDHPHVDDPEDDGCMTLAQSVPVSQRCPRTLWKETKEMVWAHLANANASRDPLYRYEYVDCGNFQDSR